MITQDDVERLWAALDNEAEELKLSHHAVLRFEEFYRSLSDPDRLVVDEVLASWMDLGLDSRRRFDALAVISRFEVRSALPALRSALGALDSQQGPGVPFERVKLERVIAKLETDDGP